MTICTQLDKYALEEEQSSGTPSNASPLFRFRPTTTHEIAEICMGSLGSHVTYDAIPSSIVKA